MSYSLVKLEEPRSPWVSSDNLLAAYVIGPDILLRARVVRVVDDGMGF